MIDQAFTFASIYHRGQKDLQGVPYIWHPMRVALALKDAGYDERHQVAGLLHDTVEDTKATLLHIKEQFGEEVVVPIDHSTRRAEEEYRDFIDRRMSDPIALKVLRYDLFDNTDPTRMTHGVPMRQYIRTMNLLNEIEVGVIGEWEDLYERTWYGRCS